jgi:hypothetical protein
MHGYDTHSPDSDENQCLQCDVGQSKLLQQWSLVGHGDIPERKHYNYHKAHSSTNATQLTLSQKPRAVFMNSSVQGGYLQIASVNILDRLKNITHDNFVTNQFAI